MGKKRLLVSMFSLAMISLLPRVNAQNYLRVNQKDGKVIEIAIADIQKLCFVDIVSSTPRQRAIVLGAALKLKTYPNPAKDLVNIEYTLAAKGFVTIEVYNIQGSLIYSSKQGNQSEGEYQFIWNANNVSSGSYYCRIRQNNKLVTKKIILNK